jgi:SAM-dependent methyltransferase
MPLLLYLYLQRKTDLFTSSKSRRFLHIASEACLSTVFRKIPNVTYQTGDLFDPAADIKVDICNMQFPDNTFDIILCSHVLEHVPDDQKAMREFSRTLKRDGWAMLLVPVTLTADKTFEDPTITDPDERNRIFGPDHVRLYGLDYVDRLKQNNFEVSCTYAKDFLSQEEMELMGVTDAGEIYFCTKATGSPVASQK